MQVLFKLLRSPRAFEEVSNRVKQLVFKGVLKPGEKLPSEGQLAAQFGVGRQTIREALRVLELSGFIEVQRGGAGGPTIKNTILATVSRLKPNIKKSSIVVSSHEEILDAIIRRDSERALALLEGHLLSVNGWLKKSHSQPTGVRKVKPQR